MAPAQLWLSIHVAALLYASVKMPEHGHETKRHNNTNINRRSRSNARDLHVTHIRAWNHTDDFSSINEHATLSNAVSSEMAKPLEETWRMCAVHGSRLMSGVVHAHLYSQVASVSFVSTLIAYQMRCNASTVAAVAVAYAVVVVACDSLVHIALAVTCVFSSAAFSMKYLICSFISF